MPLFTSVCSIYVAEKINETDSGAACHVAIAPHYAVPPSRHDFPFGRIKMSNSPNGPMAMPCGSW